MKKLLLKIIQTIFPELVSLEDLQITFDFSQERMGSIARKILMLDEVGDIVRVEHPKKWTSGFAYPAGMEQWNKMTIRLWCRIWGHNFVVKTQDKEEKMIRTTIQRSNWCVKCGLTKDEIRGEIKK